MSTLLGVILFFTLQISLSIGSLFENCDYVLDVNEHITISTKNNFNNESSNRSCRYVLKAPIYHRVEVVCALKVKDAESCADNNNFFISSIGDKDIYEAPFYCGNYTVNVSSIFQSLTLAYNVVNDGIDIDCDVNVREEQSDDCECGWSTGQKIVGGEKAGIFEFPSIAALVAVNDPDNPCNGSCNNSEGVGQNEIFCGGTIVSHHYVISTATCIQWYKPEGKLMVVVGQYDTDLAQKSKYTQHIMVESWKLIKRQVYYMSILKLSASIEWSYAVGPACLPFTYQDFDFVGQSVIMAGWGITGVNQNRSSVLLKTYVPVITGKQCEQMASDIYPHEEICTDLLSHGACVLDTGGPVIFQTVRQYFIGIIGYRHECGKSRNPGVNVKIASFLKIIEEDVDDKFCRK